jgi:Holliday junction resolvase RusA-like endonuclease
VKIAFTILGEPASKANSRQLVTFGRGAKARPALIKSDKARNYEKTALLQIPASAKVMLTGPVRVTLRIFYATERPDLDESVVLDVLQAKFAKGTRDVERAGVYVNDRQVREKHVYHGIDRANPRTEIEVEEIRPVTALFESLPVPVLPARARRRMQRVMVAAHADGVMIAPRPDGDPF